MSKKPWRNPANPDYKSTAVDTSTVGAGLAPPAAQLAPTAQQPATAAAPQRTPQRTPPTDSGPGSDAWAILTLRRTAEFLDEFVQAARAALKRVAPEKLDAILNQPVPEPQTADPKKRPRGAAHPISVLHKLAIGAARLLERLLKASNPSLFTMSPEKANNLAVAREGADYLARVNHARAQHAA